MRTLTIGQKKFLVEWANKNTIIMDTTADPTGVMSDEDWQKLVKMNDTEILWQNCNRFLNDLELKINPITQKSTYFWKK